MALLVELRGDAAEAESLRAAAEALRQGGPEATALVAKAARRGRATTGVASASAATAPPAILPSGASATSPRVSFWIQELCQKGTETVLRDMRARLPRDLGALLSSVHLTPEEVLAIHRRSGATSALDFSAQLAGGLSDPARPSTSDLELRLKRGLIDLWSSAPRISLGRAYAVLDSLTELLTPEWGITHLEPAGSMRRVEPTVSEITVFMVSDQPDKTLSRLSNALERPEHDVLHLGPSNAHVVVRRQEIQVRVVPEHEYGGAIAWATGSRGHLEQLQRRAKQRGLILSPAGLTTITTGQTQPIAQEEEVYRALDLPFIVPELRHGENEIEIAERGGFEELLDVTDIRGDLHVHSLWSDGRDPIDTMVRAAKRLRYNYLAITDHSPSAAASRVLTVERLQRQMDEIRALRKVHPDIQILQGVEVDILPDGSLDLPDRLLAELDIVLASLHDRSGQSDTQLTERCLTALRNPFVQILTHPANRIVGREDGYSLDFAEVFRVAAETGTILEVDGAPNHLDLDGHLAARAISAGALLSVDSDCHQATSLGRQMQFGVGTARRGGVPRGSVINTRHWPEVRAILAHKRAAMAHKAPTG